MTFEIRFRVTGLATYKKSRRFMLHRSIRGAWRSKGQKDHRSIDVQLSGYTIAKFSCTIKASICIQTILILLHKSFSIVRSD